MSSKTKKKSPSSNSKTKKNINKPIKGYKIELELTEPNTSSNTNLDITTFKTWCEDNLITEIGYLGAEKICNVTYKIKSKNVLKLRFYLDATFHSYDDADDYCDYINNLNNKNMLFKVKNKLITNLYKAFKCN